MSYIKSKSFKIISRFYVIYGDYSPVYVGYTNRTVKQRFREHQKDKDFSDYENVEVKELVDEKLSFDFTWDYNQTCKNADNVSLREGQLVQQYGTQDSVFQKADGGGQTWASEKWFVKSNKDNPRFIGLSGAEIKRLLKEEKVAGVWLNHFVGHIIPIEEQWIKSFVEVIKTAEEVWLSGFVCSMRPVEERWLIGFANTIKLTEKSWLGVFVKDIKPVEERWLSDFVSHMKSTEEVWLGNFVNNMQLDEEKWLASFVGNMKPVGEVWLSGFVESMKLVEKRWLSDFVSHMRLVEEAWLSNFVGNMRPIKNKNLKK